MFFSRISCGVLSPCQLAWAICPNFSSKVIAAISASIFSFACVGTQVELNSPFTFREGMCFVGFQGCWDLRAVAGASEQEQTQNSYFRSHQ